MEQAPLPDIYQQPVEQPRERIRTMLARTTAKLWRDELVVPEDFDNMYAVGIEAGIANTYDMLVAVHEYLEQNPRVPHGQLRQMLRDVAAPAVSAKNVGAAILGASFAESIPHVLGAALPEPGALPMTRIRQLPYNMYTYKDEEVSQDDLLPEEYFFAPNGLGLLHVQASERQTFSTGAIALNDATKAIDYLGMGGSVINEILARYKRQVPQDEFYAELIRLPYKLRIFDRSLATYQDTQPKARQALSEFIKLKNVTEKAVFINAYANNYRALMPAVSKSYATLRQGGMSQKDAVATLYANTTSFTSLTRGVTDGTVVRSSFDLETGTIDARDFTWSYRMEQGSTPHIIGRIGALPQIIFPNSPSLVPMPETVSERIQIAAENRRRGAGRCPVRHTIMFEGPDAKTEVIEAFQDDIRSRTGVHPQIFVDGGLRLTPLAASMALHASEHYRLFDALDARMAYK